ncbi:MAG: Rieske 2Fe-2S domain-containing protein [Desulfobulbus sp.]|uniref:ubiquinol-cytochrome c reductase iron-sulfur subunit n=1 Tax=Desulfobulbus sp. TaxID=895 RepID=UPI0028454BE3|nr:Rieske 2Fe-2S domain-containing protein [Desulfobulbus sp.]MDR2549448.1 Rieske 2Fe-2S domain-containing protein [Desulfobulbus sp.]
MEPPTHGTTGPSDPAMGRRDLLRRWLQWAAATGAALILYPLIRFSGHRIPPKPRLVEVPAPLPISGVHTDHDFLLFTTTEGATAVSRICTHLGCRINYQEDKQYIECPCHHSRFTPDGKRIAGPAEKNLPQYKVTAKKDGEGRVTAYVVHL